MNKKLDLVELGNVHSAREIKHDAVNTPNSGFGMSTGAPCQLFRKLAFASLLGMMAIACGPPPPPSSGSVTSRGANVVCPGTTVQLDIVASYGAAGTEREFYLTANGTTIWESPPDPTSATVPFVVMEDTQFRLFARDTMGMTRALSFMQIAVRRPGSLVPIIAPPTCGPRGWLATISVPQSRSFGVEEIWSPQIVVDEVTLATTGRNVGVDHLGREDQLSNSHPLSDRFQGLPVAGDWSLTTPACVWGCPVGVTSLPAGCDLPEVGVYVTTACQM